MKNRINGHKLGFEVLRGKGPSLLLIHGLGLDRSIWREMAEKHLRGYQVILPDIRGHGESPATIGVTRIGDLAEDMLRLMDFLEIEKVVVGGHSMGGYIALAMAYQHADRLAGLGLIASRATADTPEAKHSRVKMIEEIQKRGSRVLAESLAPQLSHDPHIQEKAYAIIEKTSSAGLIGALHALAERPSRLAFLPEIPVPSQVVAGGDDQIVPLAEAKEMARLLSNCSYLEIPAAGHMPMLETPGILGEGLRSFMETCFPES